MFLIIEHSYVLTGFREYQNLIFFLHLLFLAPNVANDIVR